VIKIKLDYDDSLDTFGLHGIGGIVGAFLTGVFANAAVNPAGANGLFKNNGAQLVNQIVAVLATISYSSIGTFILLKIVDAAVGLRISKEDELEGLDLSQHREVGYNM
jgi:Amt family ammonium transporter